MGRSNGLLAGARIPRTFRLQGRRLFHFEPLEARRLLAAGDLDNTFSNDGLAEIRIDGMFFSTVDVLVQPDGKTVMVGNSNDRFFSDTQGDRIVLVRLLLDGTLDPSFGPNGTGVVTTGIDADAHAFAGALQTDGKIVVVGTALETSGINNYQHAVVRYNPDGSLDPSFDGDGVMHFNLGFNTSDNLATDVALQGDGKIVVVGSFLTGTTPDEELSILRLNPDGSRDLTFGLLGLVASDFDRPYWPVVTIDYNGTAASNPYFGSILVAGIDLANDSAVVLRLEPDGDFSTSFDHDGQASYKVPGRPTAAFDVFAQPGGKILVAGEAFGDFLLVRFNPDGTLDPTFGDQGTGVVVTDYFANDRMTSVISSYNGDRLWVAGTTDGGDPVVSRYTNDGILDTAYKPGGRIGRGDMRMGGTPRIAAGPGRRITLAGGRGRAIRWFDDGAKLVAIGTFDPDGGSEAGREEAHFLVTRTERLPTPQRVYLNIGGTASPPYFLTGEDYVGVGEGFSISPFEGGNYVDIPANQTFVSLSIRPTDDTRAEGDETVTLSIAPDPSYDIGTPSGVTLEIHDNDATTLYPVADAYVRDGEFADVNFGAAALQTQAAEASGTGRAAEAFIKFDLSSLVFFPIASVRLQVFGRLTAAGAPVPVEAFGVSASGWGEQSITFNNKPAATTAPLARVEVASTFEFGYTFDVTNFLVREKVAGRNLVTILLRNAAPSDAHVLWSSRDSEYTDPRLIVTGSISAPGGIPRVTQVFAGSTAWTAAFRQSVEDAGLGDSAWGYAVGDGPAQLRSLPWGGVDTISVRFTRNVSVLPEHLSVRGARGGEYAVTNFQYDEENFVATWTLTKPIGGAGAGAGDKVLLDLDGDEGTGVSSFFLTPRYLDGEWSNGADAYDSGDGLQGGDFRFLVNALRGDVDGDGQVTPADLNRLRAHLPGRASAPFSAAPSAYSPLYDLDGNGRVDARDVAALRAELFSRLPADPPVAPAAAPAPRRLPAARRAYDLTA